MRYYFRAPKRKYSDFRVFYTTGQQFLSKQDIYGRPDPDITPFKYSPFFAFCFIPISLLNVQSASLIFFTINFLSVILACVLSRRLVRAGPLSFGNSLLIYFLPCLFTLRFILANWDQGQVNIIMFLLTLMCLTFVEKGKDCTGAACLAAAVMIKYMPAVFIPYFLFRRKFKFVLWFGVWTAVLLMIPALYVGWQHQMEYLAQWYPQISSTSFDMVSWYHFKNQSLYSMMLRLLSSSDIQRSLFGDTVSPQQIISGVHWVGGMMLLTAVIPKKNNPWAAPIDYGLLFICMALFNPNAWLINFIVLLYVFILIASYLVENHFIDKFTLVMVILSFALANWFSESMVGNFWQNEIEKMSSVTVGSLILFITLLRLKYGKRLKQ